MRLLRRPRPDDVVQFLAKPRADSLAFVDAWFLELCTSLVVRLRGSFIGVVQVLQDMISAQVPAGFRQELFCLWLWWRTCEILGQEHMQSLADIPFIFSHNVRDSIRTWLDQVCVLLEANHLHRWTRSHLCSLCSHLRTVGLDGKVAVSAPLCAHTPGGLEEVSSVGVQILHGCRRQPLRGQRFCSQHLPELPSPAASDLHRFCPAEHPLQRLPCDRAWHHQCDRCRSAILPEVERMTCLNCDYDLCLTCANSGSQPASASIEPALFVPPLQRIVDVLSSDEEVDNPCQIRKEPLPGRLRRHGGIVTAMLACGRICGVRLLSRCESPTQILALLGSVASKRQLDYIVYDNACHLARFIRKKARRRGTQVLRSLAAAKFVIDRFHLRNHRSCCDPGSRYFLEEVRLDAHPELKDLNSSWSESWNAWIDVLTPQCRAMDSSSLPVFLWLVADLWNTRVLSEPPDMTTQHVPGPHASLLRRRRSRPTGSMD